MSAKKPKFYISSTYTCRIGYRKLTSFEERNPRCFSIAHAAHDTWEAAHAAMVEHRKAEVKKAKAALVSAEKQLKRVMEMERPELEE